MSLTVKQKLNKLRHDPIKNEYMGLIDEHHFELSHFAGEWECRTTGLFNCSRPAGFKVWGPSPIKALSKAMKRIAKEDTNA